MACSRHPSWPLDVVYYVMWLSQHGCFADSLKSIYSLASDIASPPIDLIIKHSSLFNFVTSLLSPSLMEIAWWFEVVTASFRSLCMIWSKRITEAWWEDSRLYLHVGYQISLGLMLDGERSFVKHKDIALFSAHGYVSWFLLGIILYASTPSLIREEQITFCDMFCLIEIGFARWNSYLNHKFILNQQLKFGNIFEYLSILGYFRFACYWM